MTTILYMFWDGFSGATPGATITGQWANVIEAKAGGIVHAYSGGHIEVKAGGRIEANA